MILKIGLPFSFRHGVVATPGERLTAQNTPNGEEQTDDKAPFLEGLDGIGRTGWVKAAARRLERRNEFLIEFYEPYRNIFHRFPFSVLPTASFFGASSKSESFLAA